MLEAERYGYDQLQMVEEKDVPDYVDCPHYIGGQYDHYAGDVQPLNLVCGQAKAAQELGVRVFEDSEVTEIGYGRRPQAKTARGHVNSDFLIVCGNGYLAMGRTAPKINRKILPVNSFILATEPLPEEVHKKLLPKDSSVFDFRKLLDYYRLSADKRLLFGG
jgi:gamma-glutamylputrescine oxidase